MVMVPAVSLYQARASSSCSVSPTSSWKERMIDENLSSWDSGNLMNSHMFCVHLVTTFRLLLLQKKNLQMLLVTVCARLEARSQCSLIPRLWVELGRYELGREA